MKKVAILYGLAEGPLLNRELAQELAAAEYELVDQVEQADFVFAHSGGILALPNELPGKTVVIIAPATGHDGRLVRTLARKIARDFLHHWHTRAMRKWWRKTAINAVYFANVGAVYKMWRGAKRVGQSLPKYSAAKVAVIAVAGDPWSAHLGAEHDNYTYMTIGGQHDDIWVNPAPYVRLLQYL